MLSAERSFTLEFARSAYGHSALNVQPSAFPYARGCALAWISFSRATLVWV
jgi:hypothetical protein